MGGVEMVFHSDGPESSRVSETELAARWPVHAPARFRPRRAADNPGASRAIGRGRHNHRLAELQVSPQDTRAFPVQQMQPLLL